MEKYEVIKDIGSGNFGVAKLVRDVKTKELFAVKFIERGQKIDEHVQREIINHRSLRHPHIIRFKEVLLTPTHLAIVMEYAAGGELFERICNAGRFSEDEGHSAPWRHTLEGPDDMPAHIKSSMFGCNLTIPITDGRLNMGTWQGIWLCEHRDHATPRKIVVTLNGI